MAHQILELWTDKADDLGATFRMYYRLYTYNTELERYEWHYFGSTTSEYPLPTEPWRIGTLVTHAYVSFPQGFRDMTAKDAQETMFDAALRSGLSRDNMERA